MATDLGDVTEALQHVDASVKHNEKELLKLHSTFVEVQSALSRMRSEEKINYGCESRSPSSTTI